MVTTDSDFKKSVHTLTYKYILFSVRKKLYTSNKIIKINRRLQDPCAVLC